MSANLHVGNLSFSTTDQEWQEFCSAPGHVASAKGMADRYTGRFRGVRIVEMSSPDEAQAAITALHGAELRGQVLVANEAQPQEPRHSFSGRPKNVD